MDVENLKPKYIKDDPPTEDDWYPIVGYRIGYLPQGDKIGWVSIKIGRTLYRMRVIPELAWPMSCKQKLKVKLPNWIYNIQDWLKYPDVCEKCGRRTYGDKLGPICAFSDCGHDRSHRKFKTKMILPTKKFCDDAEIRAKIRIEELKKEAKNERKGLALWEVDRYGRSKSVPDFKESDMNGRGTENWGRFYLVDLHFFQPKNSENMEEKMGEAVSNAYTAGERALEEIRSGEGVEDGTERIYKKRPGDKRNIKDIELEELEAILLEKRLIAGTQKPFNLAVCRLLEESKYHRHSNTGEIWGYGKKLLS